jgi:pimeloyl-ACP methyl ester carboxylesterase
MTRPSEHADNYHLDVVFVHGLGSDANAWVNEPFNWPWANKKPPFNWPDELGRRSQHLNVLIPEYFAPMFKSGDTDVQQQFQMAAIGFLDKLRSKGLGIRPIVFIAHSLGGIIVKQALRLAQQSKDANGQHRPDSIFTMTRCVIFLSTPHAGAAIANADAFVERGVRGAGFGLKLVPFSGIIQWGIKRVANRFRSSALTRQLRKDDSPLLDLNYWYRSVPNIDTHAFYETKRTYFVQVVDPLSADPGVSACIPRRADKKDHISICKPPDGTDWLFIAVADIIEGVRVRVRAGKDYPIFRNRIREIVTPTKFACYGEAGNFAEIPAEDDHRTQVETLLRLKLEEQFETGGSIEASQEQAARESIYDIDKFVLSLWLEKKVRVQLETLSSYISQAEKVVRTASAAPPPTLILLYRAARTLDHVLLEFDYGKLGRRLKRAYKTVNSRHSKDPEAVDANGATRDLLEKLESVARDFDETTRRASTWHVDQLCCPPAWALPKPGLPMETADERRGQVDEGVIAASEVRRLEQRVRELEGLLGRKTMEVESLKEALDLARVKKPTLLSRSQLPEDTP